MSILGRSPIESSITIPQAERSFSCYVVMPVSHVSQKTLSDSRVAGGDHKMTYDWMESPTRSAQLLYTVSIDAMTLVFIATIAAAVNIVLGYLSRQTEIWTFFGVQVALYDVVHYANFFTFVVFLVVSSWNVIKWAFWRCAKPKP